MKRLKNFVLSILLVTSLIIPSAYAKSADLGHTEAKTDLLSGVTKLNEVHWLVEEKDVLDEKERIQELLNQDGNSVTFYNVDLNKELIYDTFLKDEKVPRLMSVESANNLDHSGKIIDSQDDFVVNEKSEMVKSSSQDSTTTISTDLTIINNNGVYYVIDGSVTVPTITKKLLTNSKLNKLFTIDKKAVEVQNYKSKLKDVEKEQLLSVNSLSTTPTTILTGITKSNWYYADSLFYDLDTFEIASSITEYTIYKNEDSNSSYDWLTVHAFNTWYPAYSNYNIVTGIQGTIDNYYTGDDLVSYSPNTGSIDSSLSNNTTYSIGIGYPWAANFNVSWNSGASVKMQAVGDQSTDKYYQFFYGTQNSIYYSVGSGNPIDTEYSATYKSSGTLLGLYVTSHVRHSWFNEGTNNWRNNTDVLTYDY